MVNNPNLRIVPADECIIVPSLDAEGMTRNKITNGPVYDLKEAQKEARKRQFFYVTLKSIDDRDSDDVPTGNDLKAFIEALDNQTHYQGSERCETSPSITPPPWTIDADSFTMRWNNEYLKEFGDATKYYLKFGFSQSNDHFMIVSMHESKNG